MTAPSKYKYYITDLNQGDIIGTNKEKLAMDYSYSDDAFVVDTALGQQIVNGEPVSVRSK